MTAKEARKHLHYSKWATQRLLDAMMALPAEQRDQDVGAAHKGLTGTLDHILFGDRVWFARMLGMEMEAIPADWAVVHKCWDDWAASATNEDLERIVECKDLRGTERMSLACEIVMHVVNYATLRRGQVMNMLRQMDIAASSDGVDLITWDKFAGAPRERRTPQGRA